MQDKQGELKRAIAGVQAQKQAHQEELLALQEDFVTQVRQTSHRGRGGGGGCTPSGEHARQCRRATHACVQVWSMVRCGTSGQQCPDVATAAAAGDGSM